MVYSADRIFTNTSATGEILETMGDVFRNNEKIMRNVKTIGDAAVVIQQTQANIDTLKEIDFSSQIIEGKSLKVDLIGGIDSGQAVNGNLKSSNAIAEDTLESIIQWTEENKDISDLNNRVKETSERLEQRVSKSSSIRLNDDLDHYKEEGLFNTAASLVALSIKHKPENVKSSFSLFIEKNSNVFGYIRQTLKDCVEKGNSYTRVLENGEWKPWVKLLDSRDLIGVKTIEESKERRAITTNRYTYGERENAVVMSVQGNVTEHVNVMGLASPSQASAYSSRDSVGLYVDNAGTTQDIVSFTDVGRLFVTLPGYDLDENLKLGMFIDLTSKSNLDTEDQSIIQGNKYTGQVVAWDNITKKVEVSWWFKMGNSEQDQIPVNVNRAIINPITKVWAHNSNLFMNEEHTTHEGQIAEMALFNKKSKGVMAGFDLLYQTLTSLKMKYGFRVKGFSNNGQKVIENGYIAHDCETAFKSGKNNTDAFITDNRHFEITADGKQKHDKKDYHIGNESLVVDPMKPIYILSPSGTDKQGSILNGQGYANFSTKIMVLGTKYRLIATEGKIITRENQFNYIDIEENQCVELFSDGVNFYKLSTT